MPDFTDTVIIVTGAGGNLGQAVARAFLAAGGRMALVDQSADRLRQLYSDLAPWTGHYLGEVDLRDPAPVRAMVQDVVRRLGRVDVLVNTVGGFKAGTPVHETPVDVWDRMMDLNARTAFVASQAVIPAMLCQGAGRIIHIGARPGLVGKANMAAYAASKSAVLRLTESLAAELRDTGINVNCVEPGTIDTPQNREAMPSTDQSRWVSPASLAEVILFLASDAARDVHGAIIPVHGRS